MNKTKQKIILSAVSLFNERGLMNVKNQDIAEKSGISLSNFNYHFSNKKDLVLAVIKYMTVVLEERIYGNQMLFKKGQGLEITKLYFEFEEEFKFFYLDTYNVLQTYPEVKEEMLQRINEAIQIIKNLNYMSIGMGYLKPEPEDIPGLYDHLAHQIWMNNHFWFAQMQIRGEEGDIVKKGLEACMTISYPYLTEKGRQVYRAFVKGASNN